MNKIILLLICSLVLFTTCTKEPEIDDEIMLDGSLIQDPSIENPEQYLVSYQINAPSEAQKNIPVVVAIHGFSATTYEWLEFKSWADNMGGILTSTVLLGGHGKDYETFKNATWQDWQKPIIEEYRRLDSMGFNNISFLGSSAACPLLLDMFNSGKIKEYTIPKHLLMLDPIVVSSDKILYLADYVGGAVGYIDAEPDTAEEGHWYRYRPQEALNELLTLIDISRKDLEDGIVLPEGTNCKVYKSLYDPTADPVSAVLIYKGLTLYNGNKVEIKMVDSDLHVYTRLMGRETYSQKDIALQLETFNDIWDVVME